MFGCKQKHGVDYRETFTPMAKMATIRTLLAVVEIQNWIIVQMDVTNAFLTWRFDRRSLYDFPSKIH